MRRLLVSALLALLALCALASTAFGAVHRPTITSVSPGQVPIGGKLVLKGKYFASGVRNNRVFFSRATDGKSVRVRPTKATKTRMEVAVPARLTALLADDGQGGKKATRFRLMIFTKVLGPKTKTSRSPIILPAGSVPTNGGGTGTTAPPPPAPDCDGDGISDAQDADDDNDGLSDDLETAVHTNVCNKDTDGDGVEDGFEYWSAKDLNNSAIPYAGKKPYPNPLDATDKDTDFDGDGLTDLEESSAWNLYGGRVLPTADGQTFPYSGGNQSSSAGGGPGGSDFDQNGRLTDDEKDADGDGLANWVELSKGSTDGGDKTAFGSWHALACTFVADSPRYQDCGAGPVPNGNTFTNGNYPGYFNPNWLDPDTDGDGITDNADDQDRDDISNASEIAAQTNPVNPCDPNPEARICSQH